MAKKTVFKPRKQHFPGIDKIAYEGTDSDRALAFGSLYCCWSGELDKTAILILFAVV